MPAPARPADWLAGVRDETLVAEIAPGGMANPRFGLVVRRQLFGQLRLQLCAATPGAPILQNL